MKTLRKSALTFTLLSMIALSGMPVSRLRSEFKNLNEVTEQSFNISVVKDDAVSVTNLPTSSTSGKRVDFSLTFDANTYAVDNVLVNDESPIHQGENNYSFLMPSESVVVTIVGDYVDATYGKHSITNLDADKNVVLVGLPDYAAAGDILKFSVDFGWNSGYSFNGNLSVFAVDDSGNRTPDGDVNVEFNAIDNTYRFTMPDSKVAIDVETVAKKFTITRDTKANANISTLKYSLDGGETYTSSSSSSLNLPFATKVQITLKSSDSLKPTSLKLKTSSGLMEVALDSGTLVGEFEMPASNVSFVIEGNVNYKKVTLNNTEHLTITLLTKNEDGTYTPSIDNEHCVPSDTIYFKVVSDDEDIIVNSVKVTYNGSSTITTTTVDASNNIYSFVMKNYDDVTITVTEKNVSLYKGKAFVGTFYGYNLYGSKYTVGQDATPIESYDTNINGSGEIYLGTSSTAKTTISSYTSTSDGGNDGIINLANGKDAIYTPNFILGCYNLGYNFSSNFNNDFLLATKRVDSSDTRSNYKFTVLWNKTNFLAVQSYRVDSDGNSTYIASLFVDFVNKEYYGENLAFELADGMTTISSNTSCFDVVVNGTIVGTVNNNSYAKA